MGKVKGGIPWALPWEASLTKLLASARLPASSFVAPSWPGVWPWLSSAERVTCCSVSVTSCRVCSLTTAVWKTGFGLMRTCRKPEEHTVSWKLLTGVCSSLYLIRNYSPNEWKQAWKQAFASVTSCCGRPDVSISVQTSTTFHLSFHLSLFLHAVGHNESFNVNILQSFHSLFYINNTSKVKPECRHTFLLICTKQPLYHLACYHFFFLLYCNTRALLMPFLHHDACDFLAAVVWDVFCFALSLTGM